MLIISLVLLVSQFEILGKDDNDEHLLNILLISVKFLVSHFEISGNDDIDEHQKNI